MSEHDDEEALRRELMGETEPPPEAPRRRRRRVETVAAAEPEEAEVVEEPSGEEGEAEEVRLHPVLTNDEYLDAQRRAHDRFAAERRKAALKAVEDQALADLRYEQGLITGDGRKDEKVTITLDLAEHSADIKLDGRQYWHGQTYTVPRHVADTLAEIQARGWNHQDEVDGKNLEQRHRANRQFRSIAKGAPGGTSLSATTGQVH